MHVVLELQALIERLLALLSAAVPGDVSRCAGAHHPDQPRLVSVDEARECDDQEL